jgi:hypothetical protein
MISRKYPSDLQTLEDFILAGNAFFACTGSNVSSADGLKGICIFNPAGNSKTVYLYRTLINLALSTIHPNLTFQVANGDSNYSRTITPKNMNIGNNAVSTLHVTQSAVSSNVTADGTNIINSDALSSINTDLLISSGILVIPPNTGVVLYIQAKNLDVYSTSFFWIEL